MEALQNYNNNISRQIIMNNINFKILLSFRFIISGILIGVLIWLIDKSLANQVAKIGTIYLNLIEMCVLPIMITGIISGFGNLFHSDLGRLYVKKLFFVFFIGLLASSIFGIIIGVIGMPGAHLSDATKLVLSHNISQMQNNMQESSSSTGLLQFISNIVPVNIFSSLNQGNMLAVLFFCMLLGIALGCVRSEATKLTVSVSEGIFSALLKMVMWIMYGLPIGLCFLFAGYVAQIGFTELFALSRLIILFYVGLILMAIGYSLIIWYYVGGNYWTTIKSFKETLVISFGTSSSVSAIPSMIANLQQNFKLDKNVVDFVVPLGINLNRHGTVLRIVISALFTMQLYHQSLTMTHLLIIIITSILAAIAASGVPGIASIGVLALVLQPLGLPASVGISLLAVLVPITDPIITVVNVYCNCATAIVVAKRLPKRLLNENTSILKEPI
jgi:proton glutamate symport protein